jgi:hypothetical protein
VRRQGSPHGRRPGDSIQRFRLVKSEKGEKSESKPAEQKSSSDKESSKKETKK